MVQEKENISKASKGLIEGYYNSSKDFFKGTAFGMQPEFDRGKVIEAIRKDGMVIAAITTLVDKALQNGYKVKDEKFVKRLRRLRFDKELRTFLFNLFGFNNLFIENVKNGKGQVKELHTLEITTTQPCVDEHGTPMGYEQISIGEAPSGQPTWNPEEVTFISTSSITTNPWGEIDLQAVYTSVLIKQYIYRYIGWLTGTNQFKSFYQIKNANKDQVADFISYLKKSQDSLENPMIAQGEIEHTVMRDFSEGATLMTILQKCDNNILALLQTPPISMGQPGDSNRSNSDSQESSLDTRVIAVQRVLEEGLNNDLFPKMGVKDAEFKFEKPNKSNIAKMLENAERMKNMGFKNEVIEEYLKLEDFPVDGGLLKTEEEILLSQEKMAKSMDMYPSRQGKSEGESNEKIGTGKEGTTREDQLVSKAYEGITFNLYEDE